MIGLIFLWYCLWWSSSAYVLLSSHSGRCQSSLMVSVCTPPVLSLEAKGRDSQEDNLNSLPSVHLILFAIIYSNCDFFFFKLFYQGRYFYLWFISLFKSLKSFLESGSVWSCYALQSVCSFWQLSFNICIFALIWGTTLGRHFNSTPSPPKMGVGSASRCRFVVPLVNLWNFCIVWHWLRFGNTFQPKF